MSNRDYRIMEDAMRSNRDIDDMVREIERERDMGQRKIDRIMDDSIESANAIDKELRPNRNFEDILITCFAAHLGIVCKESLRMRLSRDVEAVITEVDDCLREINSGRRDRDRRDERRGTFGSRRDDRNDRRRDNRRDDRDEDRDNRRERGGFGKGAGRGKDNERQRDENREAAFKGKQTLAFDSARRKLLDGSLVEHYEDHELKPSSGVFDRSRVEQARKLFVDDSRLPEQKYTPRMYTSYHDFVNTTNDGPLEIGIVTRQFNYSFNDDMIEEIFIKSSDTDQIKLIMGMLSRISAIETPAFARLYKRINKLALDALYITFNMYSKVGAEITGSAVDEWEVIQADLDKPEIFDPMVSGEVREIFNGLLRNFASLDFDKDKNTLTITSTFFAGKSAGDFVNRTKIAGEGRLAVVTEDAHPELSTAATAVLEVRDNYMGDAWSSYGIIPVVITDSEGMPLFVLANKASSTKYLLAKLFPTAFLA